MVKDRTKKFLLIILGFIVILFINNSVSADMGPKPTMGFDLIYENSTPISLVGGAQIECMDETCTDGGAVLQRNGPQVFGCDSWWSDLEVDYQPFVPANCYSLAYGYAPYHKLILNFSDNKTRESNIFSTNAFNSKFEVTITDDSLIVKEVTPFFSRRNTFYFVEPLIITLILELLTALIYFTIKKLPKKLLIYVAIANLISLPIVWFVFSLLQMSMLLMLLVSETFAVLFEGGFIYFFNKSRITLRQALLLSLVMNAISLFLGNYIYFQIWDMLPAYPI